MSTLKVKNLHSGASGGRDVGGVEGSQFCPFRIDPFSEGATCFPFVVDHFQKDSVFPFRVGP